MKNQDTTEKRKNNRQEQSRWTETQKNNAKLINNTQEHYKQQEELGNIQVYFWSVVQTMDSIMQNAVVC